MARTFLGTEILDLGSSRLVTDLDELYALVAAVGASAPQDRGDGTVEYVGLTDFDNSGITAPTTFPSDWQQGDFCVIHGGVNGTDAVNLPSGWNPHPSSPTTGNVLVGGGLQHFSFWRILQSGDVAPTLANAAGISKSWQGFVKSYRQVDPVSPIGAFAASTPLGAAALTVNLPSMTPPRDNSRLVYAATHNAGTTAATTLTAPAVAGMKTRGLIESLGSAKRPVLAADEWRRAGAGVATGTRPFVSSISNNGLHVFGMALNPVSADPIANADIVRFPMSRGGPFTADAGSASPQIEVPGTLREIHSSFDTPSSSGNIKYDLYRVDPDGTQTLVVQGITLEYTLETHSLVGLSVPHDKDHRWRIDPQDAWIGADALHFGVTLISEASTA